MLRAQDGLPPDLVYVTAMAAEQSYIVQSSNFSPGSPCAMTVWYEGMQIIIEIPIDRLVGTRIYAIYDGYIGLLDDYLGALNDKADRGITKQFPWNCLEPLKKLVWEKCKKCADGYAPRARSERISLQDCIQPPTLHLTIVNDDTGENGVIAKSEGEFVNNYSWDISRIATSKSEITNSYGWGTAPLAKQNLSIIPGMAAYDASQLSLDRNALRSGLMQQVHSATGARMFFKPRSDLMAPEFDREISVLSSILSHDLHKTLRISPFKGLVLLGNGLVTGMVFDWLEGSPLANHPELGNPMLHEIWRQQVETIVDKLHQHKIVWGDVNVHNIFIDVNNDAWVIDFGGNCNVQFVDEELKETYEGDRQGVQRVFEEWLPSQVLTSNQRAPH